MLRDAGRPAVYFDGPAGSQVPQRVVDAVGQYLIEINANHGGDFATSRRERRHAGRGARAAADLLGVRLARATVFGANMTTLTFAFSRAIWPAPGPGDEVIVTRLDHDANVTPWVLAARDAARRSPRSTFGPSDCTLDLDELSVPLSPRTRLVAVGCASNPSGTINPVAEITALAHDGGRRLIWTPYTMRRTV